MEYQLLAYGLSKEIVTAIIMLNSNTKDGDKNLFDIVTGVLQRDILAPYLFIIYLDFVLRTTIENRKENSFALKRLGADDTP